MERADLSEVDSRAYGGAKIAEHLVRDYQLLIEGLRETIAVAQRHGDEGTADDAIAMLNDKEKQLWMFTAYRG